MMGRFVNKTGRGVEGKGHTLIGFNILLFTYGSEGNHENLSPAIMSLNVSYMEEEFCPLEIVYKKLEYLRN
jgi:hypothetical protein